MYLSSLDPHSTWALCVSPLRRRRRPRPNTRGTRVAPPSALLYVLILGVFSSAVAYCAWAKALSLAKNTSSVSNYMFVTPFLTTLLGLWIAGEPVELPTVAGGALIIIGLLLFRFGERLFTRKRRA